MVKRTIIQPGAPCSDLFVYAHIDGAILRPVVPAVTDDAFVTVLAGAGTSAYQGIVAAAGGWRSYVTAIERELHHPVRRTCLITWSAGSKMALEAVASADPPDAVVMLDGLYANKPAGSRMGDGRVQPNSGLDALCAFALKAAQRQVTSNGSEQVLVIFHSRIATPYASSKECAEYVQAAVEQKTGRSMTTADVDPTMLDGHFFVEALTMGNLHIVEFGGADAAEHIREAHLWDEACRLWVPWLTGPNVCSDSTSTQWRNQRVLSLTTPMMRGEDVRLWQRFLIDQGVTVVADGVFGPATKKQTEFWQTAYALPATGALDSATLAMATAAGYKPGATAGPMSIPSPTPAEAPTSIIGAVLACARADVGVREDLGHNDGRRIREMLSRFGVGPGANWCAAAVSTWILDGAAQVGTPPPIAGSAGAQAVMQQFKSANRWLSVYEARKNPGLVAAGMVPVWDRSVSGRPETSWWGHIGVATTGVTQGVFHTIEGNSGPSGESVAEMVQRLDNPKLFGFGRLD